LLLSKFSLGNQAGIGFLAGQDQATLSLAASLVRVSHDLLARDQRLATCVAKLVFITVRNVFFCGCVHVNVLVSNYSKSQDAPHENKVSSASLLERWGN
jgi:hypothetical protein